MRARTHALEDTSDIVFYRLKRLEKWFVSEYIQVIFKRVLEFFFSPFLIRRAEQGNAEVSTDFSFISVPLVDVFSPLPPEWSANSQNPTSSLLLLQ